MMHELTQSEIQIKNHMVHEDRGIVEVDFTDKPQGEFITVFISMNDLRAWLMMELPTRLNNEIERDLDEFLVYHLPKFIEVHRETLKSD